MSKRLMLITSLCAWLCVTTAFAGEHVRDMQLTIDELFELIDSNNVDVKVARNSVAISQQGEAVAKAGRLPDVSASLSLSYLGDATILDRDFSAPMRADMPHFGNTFKVTAYQPVYAGGAIAGAIDVARTRTLMSELGLENTVASTRFKVLECYLNLFKFRNLLDVYKENIALTQRLIDNMKASNAQGIVLKNDITRYELKLSNLRYDSTTVEDNIRLMNHNINSYLGLKDDVSVVPDARLLDSDYPVDCLADWQLTAKGSSLDMKGADFEYRLAVQNDRIVKSSRMPHIGLVAGNTFDGPITIEVPPINKNLNYWWVGVNISYNISSLFKTNKETKRSRLEIYHADEKREATADAVTRNIEQAYILYIQAHDQLKTQRKNIELASENYRIVNHRFENQLALLTDMLDASSAKLDAEVRLVNAQINVIYFYYQLKFISGTL